MSLRSDLRALGALFDKTRADFVAVLGWPTATIVLNNNHQLVLWNRGRFFPQRLAVVFDRSRRFAGIAATYDVRLPANADRRVQARVAREDGRRAALVANVTPSSRRR